MPTVWNLQLFSPHLRVLHQHAQATRFCGGLWPTVKTKHISKTLQYSIILKPYLIPTHFWFQSYIKEFYRRSYISCHHIDRFHCHATKNWIGNRPVEETKKMKCYKRLIYKQFVQVSGLYGSVHHCILIMLYCTISVLKYQSISLAAL